MGIISDYDKGFLDGRTTRIESLQKELAKWKEWGASEYTDHHRDCMYRNTGEPNCTCGLDNLLKGGEK